MTDGPNPQLPVILLVEDDADDAFLAESALEKAGVPHQVIRLGDGEQAIKYLAGDPPFHDRKAHPLPWLVLLDLKMPGITGFEVLTWVKTRPDLASIPIVVLTGSILGKDRAEAHQLGAVGYEIKPMDFKSLVNIVQGIGLRWLNNPP